MALYLSNYNRRTDEFIISSTENAANSVGDIRYMKSANRNHVIKAIQSGMNIDGVTYENGELEIKVKCFSEVLLDHLELGMPLRYKLDGRIKHAIYMGKEGDRYYFMDGDTQFAFSENFLYDNQRNLYFTTEGLDPVKLANILKKTKEGK